MLPGLLLVLLGLVKDTISVRFDYLGVPGSVLRGEPVWLDCGYDLQMDELYSVKWYKDNVEFYRFLPSDQPPSQMYNLKGVFLDLDLSNETHAFLKTTDLNTEGTYGCEVSTEAPSFRTVKAEKELRVYVIPDGNPTITGMLNRYPPGEEVNISCSFGPSKPGAILSWLINGKPAPRAYISQQISQILPDGLESTESRLTFVVDPSHQLQGSVSLQCTASISQVYSKSSDELIVGDGTSGAEFQHVIHVPPGQEGPSISGGMSRYDVGDIVDVNCTSARLVEPAELKWYINDKEATAELILAHNTVHYLDGLISTRVGLKFRVHEDHFKEQEMRLKCTATLSKVITMKSVETVVGSQYRSSSLQVHENCATAPTHTFVVLLFWSVLKVLLTLFNLC